jgi:hypothetical protein
MWPSGHHEKLYHEVDAFDNVDFAMIRPLWPFAPKCWPNLCHNSIISFFLDGHNSMRYRTSVGKMRQVNNPEAANAVKVVRSDPNLLRYF